MRTCRQPLLFAALAALAVGGCAAAVPGYSPPSGKSAKASPLAAMTKSFESGTVTQRGDYQPSDAEKKLECGKLVGSMQIIMRRLDDAGNRPTQSQSSRTAQALMSPVAASKGPLPLTEEIAREKARLKAYNGLLIEKKCKPLDISAYA
ncbi:MAG TPA: hypothetical protein PK970_10505 [Hyphomicrobiaceae bacterium]|nr:hypothetical protein [Hyphomicrobiaceae bacterium]